MTPENEMHEMVQQLQAKLCSMATKIRRDAILEDRASIIDQLENGPPNGITSIGVVAMIKARAMP